MHDKITAWEDRLESRLKRPAMAVLGVALIIGGFFMIHSGDFQGLDVVVVLTGALLIGLNAKPMSDHGTR